MRIGIDIGGSAAKVGLVDDRGQVLRRDQVPTGRDVPAEGLVRSLGSAALALREGTPVAGLGIAVPGMRRPDGEGVINVSNLPTLDGFPLRAALERETGLPTVLDNDANAAALGEHRFGAGQGAARLLVITVGTGIGGGMIVEGQVHRICWEGLGDPGHVAVVPWGPKCACGGHGCAEAVAAVPALLRRANELAEPGTRYDSLAAVVAAARAGEAAAAEALHESGDILGVALAILTHVLGPDRILVGGGGIDAAGELLLEPIRESLFHHVQPFLASRLTLSAADLGNDAGLVGAAALVGTLPHAG